MSQWHRLVSSFWGIWLISALGGLYAVLGAVQLGIDGATGGPPAELLADVVLFSFLAAALLYGGRWVRRSDIDPDLHSRVVAWCYGGLAVMLGATALLEFNPGATLGDPLRWAGFLTAVGSVGGLGVGSMEAQALTRAEEAEDRERALRESEEELRALIETIPVAVFVAEADGSIVEWNQAAEEIWGGEVIESDSVAEYESYDGWWVDSGEPVDPHEWPLARALEGETVTDPAEIRIEGFDGETRTVLNHGMPIRGPDGEVRRAVVTLVDITERKEYERRLEESNERLEQFAYAASHDLQEPLRMVSSYLQLIERRYEDALDDDGGEFIEYAVDGADRMRDMIQGLLKYSRVETQGDPFEPVDLDAVLEAVLDDLQVRIEESDAEITADSLPMVYGDARQLHQVFQNLLENAIEYSGDEPPRVHVGAESDGDEWIVSVSDHGIGFDERHADRVFDVFERLHGGDRGGTGIGLALCERIVERHGGEIWAESRPGDGSTFAFTLPSEDQAGASAAEPVPRDEGGVGCAE